VRDSSRSRPQTHLVRGDGVGAVVGRAVASGWNNRDFVPAPAATRPLCRGISSPAASVSTPTSGSTAAAAAAAAAAECDGYGSRRRGQEEKEKHFDLVDVEQPGTIAEDAGINLDVLLFIAAADRLDVHALWADLCGQGGVQCAHQGAPQREAEQQKGEATGESQT
jgi:hypothetical protein